MAIQITEIEKPTKTTMRDMLRKDISDALSVYRESDKECMTFEITGYDDKYLRDKLAEVCRDTEHDMIRKRFVQISKSLLTGENEDKAYIRLYYSDTRKYRGCYLSAHSQKISETERKVYLCINLTHFEEDMQNLAVSGVSDFRSDHRWNGTKWEWIPRKERE